MSARPLALYGRRGTVRKVCLRERSVETPTRKSEASAAGRRPAVNSDWIDRLHTVPMMMRTRLGGISSAIAPDVERSAIISLRLYPRRSISGNRTGATAAMSASLDPDIPETRNMATTSTMLSPPRRCPTKADTAAISLLAIPAMSIRKPSSTKSGTASRISLLMPWSICPATTLRGRSSTSAR